MTKTISQELLFTGISTKKISQWLLVGFFIYLLVCAVGIIAAGFKLAAGDHAKELFDFASNPFAGLMIGIIATSLIQSSSSVTSIVVGLVAGGLPVSAAVPMVMGANIGTSITNTIVSLGHVGSQKEFKRAFSAATVHDFFNLFSVLIFLPLEIVFGLLEKLGSLLAAPFYHVGSASISDFNFVKSATAPIVNGSKQALISMGDQLGGILLIALGISLIFISITMVGKLLKKLMVGRARHIIHAGIGRGPVTGIASGTLVTMLVQSSSTTTSLMVPLAGSGSLSLKQIYPFTLGANVGTCVTAVLAATAATGNAEAGLQIAFIHLVYNIIAVLLIYSLPFTRFLPVHAAEYLGKMAASNKVAALVYILVVFFAMPGLCLVLSLLF